MMKRSPLKRLYLLSPANVHGKRAQRVKRAEATFDLAARLRTQGAPLGEVFSFMSGLYFRGKLTYAKTFGAAPAGIDPVWPPHPSLVMILSISPASKKTPSNWQKPSDPIAPSSS